MRPTRCIVALGLLFVTGCRAADDASVAEDAPAATAAPAFTPDLAATAQNVVIRSVQVKEGDVVLITGSARDAELLENIAVEVQKAGAHPLISLASDRLARRSFDDVPAKYDAVESKWGRILNTNANVVIAVDASESPAALEGVAPERVQARARAGSALAELSLRRGLRTVEVGNGLYPTEARATQFGMPRDELARQFWSAVNTDPAQLAATGSRLRDQLASARVVHVTHPNGTDVSFGIDNRGVFVNDGAVSVQDLSAGGASAWKYLPAGEVFARVAPGSATGKLVVDEYDYQGSPVRGLTIDIARGSITSISATSGGDAFLAAYNSAAGDGREQLTIVDIGINPAIQATPDSRVRTWVPAGMVTLVFGSDVWASGSNNSPFSISPFQPGSTVTIDGTVVVENGALRP